jgi:hypothetical protein
MVKCSEAEVRRLKARAALEEDAGGATPAHPDGVVG